MTIIELNEWFGKIEPEAKSRVTRNLNKTINDFISKNMNRSSVCYFASIDSISDAIQIELDQFYNCILELYANKKTLNQFIIKCNEFIDDTYNKMLELLAEKSISAEANSKKLSDEKSYIGKINKLKGATYIYRINLLQGIFQIRCILQNGYN